MNPWTWVTGDWKVAEPAGWKACATRSVDILVREFRGLSSPLFKNSVGGVLPKSISASDVGQTFLSAGSGDFPVPGFRVKLSALVREVGKLRNRQARKPALQFGQHALELHPTAIERFADRRGSET
jgi:hypothetical protein